MFDYVMYLDHVSYVNRTYIRNTRRIGWQKSVFVAVGPFRVSWCVAIFISRTSLRDVAFKLARMASVTLVDFDDVLKATCWINDVLNEACGCADVSYAYTQLDDDTAVIQMDCEKDPFSLSDCGEDEMDSCCGTGEDCGPVVTSRVDDEELAALTAEITELQDLIDFD